LRFLGTCCSSVTTSFLFFSWLLRTPDLGARSATIRINSKSLPSSTKFPGNCSPGGTGTGHSAGIGGHLSAHQSYKEIRLKCGRTRALTYIPLLLLRPVCLDSVCRREFFLFKHIVIKRGIHSSIFDHALLHLANLGRIVLIVVVVEVV